MGTEGGRDAPCRPTPQDVGGGPVEARRCRVLWVIKGLAAGGSERLLLTAARLRDATAFDVEVAYVLASLDDLVDPLRAQGVPVRALGPGQAWPLRLRALLRGGRYDVVHAHSPAVAVVLRALLRTLPVADRPRLVVTEHCTWTSLHPLLRLACTLSASRDDVRLAVSERVRESLPLQHRRTTRVLVHGVVLDDFTGATDLREQVRAELGLPEGVVTVVCVANYRQGKGHDDLLDVVERVGTEHPELRFLALGQGPLEGQVRRAAEARGLGERLRLLGYREDVPRVLAGCDMLLVTSHDEGGPLVVLEALAAGLPVVSTDVGQVRSLLEIAPEAGRMVPVGRPDLLADAVLALAADQSRRERAREAAAAVRAVLDGRTTQGELERVYETLSVRSVAP